LITGKNLIGFKLSALGSASFRTFNHFQNQENDTLFFDATTSEIEDALNLANKAFHQFKFCSDCEKVKFFEALVNELLNSRKEILSLYTQETGLSLSRGEVEFNRTIAQIQQFLKLIASNEWMQPSIDTAEAGELTAKSDIRKIKIGLGPVVVFGASNFPLAYSTLGGDTVSALAAGCPVIVKSHPMHAGTAELVANAVIRAIKCAGLPEGVFSNLNGNTHQIGAYLVKHPLVKAVAFTGSHNGGRALFDLASHRRDPIPVFAEMGSLNPVVVDNRDLIHNSAKWVEELSASVTNDAGQFCTKPGLVFIKSGEYVDQFINAFKAEVKRKGVKTMVHPSLKSKFLDQLAALRDSSNFDLIDELSEVDVQPLVLEISDIDFLTNALFQDEFFGPFCLIVRCKSDDQLLKCLNVLEGQLTASIFVHHEFTNEQDVKQWIRIFQDKAGRINFNNVPTGVRVCDSMHHGGPYPASTDNRFGAVGIDAIDRFLRPVCFQNFPDDHLPEILKDKNPFKIARRINGEMSFAEIIR
jgi:NADP-dependent aldehyde dehydrogenase